MYCLALTLGAGVQWHEAYDAAQQQGRFIVGGISLGSSVGAVGGWLMGGGHSITSPKFGLGTPPAFPFYSAHEAYNVTIQVLIMFFNLLLSLQMDLSSLPIPFNTQIYFGRYAAVAEVPTAS